MPIQIMKKMLIPFVVILIFIGGFLYYKKSNVTPPNPDIASYRNSSLGLSFKYPKILTTKGNTASVNVHHEVPFSHHDFCDFKGEATTTTDNLTDFNLEMHVVQKNITETIRSESPYIPEENFINNTIVPSPGFIDVVDFGNLKGYSIFEGAEGCGHTIYYLVVSDNKTLVIVNDFITIFSGAIDTENMDRASKVPGVINKAMAESIFKSIVSSLQVQ